MILKVIIAKIKRPHLSINKCIYIYILIYIYIHIYEHIIIHCLINSTQHYDIEGDNSKNKEATSQHQQMVNLLLAQRDRYKERLSQTESTMLSLQQRLDTTDSTKVYFRTYFLLLE
jgi:hypothetical protein